MPHMAGNWTGRHRPGKRRVTAFLAVVALFCCFAAAPFRAPQALAAPDLHLQGGNTRITSDADYNVISGTGDLTIRGAHVHANEIAGSIHFFGSGAVLSAADKVNIGSFYIENSTLRVNGIFQSTSIGDMVMTNSHIVADLVSLGYDYINNVPPTGDSPSSQHSDSTITARSDVIFYGGLSALSGESVVTSLEGSIMASRAPGLSARDGAVLSLYAPNGRISAPTITATNVVARSIFANDVTIRNGSFLLSGAVDEGNRENVINNTLTLINAAAGIANLKVGKSATISGGSLSAGALELLGGVTVNGGARAGIDSLKLGANETLLAVNSRVAVANFRDSTNGSAVVGANAALGLGTSDPDWILRQFDAADGSSLGPVTAALAVATPQSLAALPGIVVDGSRSTTGGVTQGTAVFAPGSLLVVSAKAAQENGAGALSGGSFDVQSGAKLYIPDAVSGGTYKVLSDNGTDAYDDESTWNGANLASGTPMLDLVRLEKFGMIGTRMVPAESVFTRLHPYLVDMLDKTYAAGIIGPPHVDSAVPGIRFLSRAISREYIANNGRLAASTIESAARMVVLGAVPQMTMAANQAGSNVMGRRSGAEPGGGLLAIGEDGAPLEETLHRHGWALWIMPIFQSTNGFGMTAGNWDMDFSGNLGGIALGCDYTFASALRLGVSLNLGGGYARGSGELAGTTNSMGFWGLGAYAGWQAGNLGLSADVAYTSAYNSLKQSLPQGMEMRPLKSDVSSWALSSGLRADYRIPTPWLDVTPHAGVLYLYLHTNGYDVKSNGTVLEGDPMRQNIWTFPVGVSLSRDLELPKGWHCRPVLDLSVIPAAGDMDAKGDVRFTGTGIDSDLETQIMDYVTWRGVLGVEFAGGDLALGLNYSFQGGMKTTAHGVTASFSYQF